MRKFILAVVALLVPLAAHAGTYAVTCTSVCAASDGTMQPSGTVLNVILASPGFQPSDAKGATDDVTLAPYNGQTIYTAPVKPLSITAQAAAALAGSVTVTSTGTPSLDGAYSVGPAAEANIAATETYILTNGDFPGGTAYYGWLDASGAPHVFPDVTEFKAFATAIGNYVSALDQLQSANTGKLPPATVIIP